MTYNLVNLATGYQNGIDWHLEWGASQFVTKTVQLGAAGYFYQQLTDEQEGPFATGQVAEGPLRGQNEKVSIRANLV